MPEFNFVFLVDFS